MGDTNSAEIAHRTHTTRDRKHYYDWYVKEQKSAIKSCGISVGNFGQNKTRSKSGQGEKVQIPQGTLRLLEKKQQQPKVESTRAVGMVKVRE